ncbi:hypothetical protein [Lactococcus garvieae]|uniref:Uncharacterized protein n=1 Tax=Lactococcus garvieae TaxID=1363 RepID=A0A1I4GGD3_9LACT|nr:hypothetical protein [Lactococcus garvieae]SFL29104.1 hypothetical protein SAMN05216438_10425 [Lactococcus garvieae]
MTDQNKVRKLIALGLVIVVLVLLGVIGLVVAMTNGNAPQPQTTSKSISSQQLSSAKRTAPSSAEVQSSSSSSGGSSQSQQESLESFLKDYQTQKLDKSELLKRQAALKIEMTDEAYQANHVGDDTSNLIAMIASYQKNKTIDTSNSTQLIEQNYLSSKIYQQQNAAPGSYYVEVTYSERPIYQKEGTSMKARYNVTMEENKVAALNLIDTQPVSGGKTSNGNG